MNVCKAGIKQMVPRQSPHRQHKRIQCTSISIYVAGRTLPRLCQVRMTIWSLTSRSVAYVPHPKSGDVSFTPDGSFLAVVERKVLWPLLQRSPRAAFNRVFPTGLRRFSVHLLQRHRLGPREAHAAADA